MRVKLRARATGGWPATWPRKPKCSPKNCCARYSPEARLKSPKMFPFFRPFLQAKGPISRDVNGRFFSVAAIALQNAPGGASTMELEANEETSLVRLLAINDFALHGRSLVDRGNLYLIPRLPAVERAHSHHRWRSEEHTSELQSHSDLVCRLLLEKKKKQDRLQA